MDAQLGHVLVSPHILGRALLDSGARVKVEDLHGQTDRRQTDRGREGGSKKGNSGKREEDRVRVD